MPHVIIDTPLTLAEVAKHHRPVVERFNDKLVRIGDAYPHLEGKGVLFETLVREKSVHQKSYLLVRNKVSAKNQLIVKLAPCTFSVQSPLWRLAIALLADEILQMHPKGKILKSNITDFLILAEQIHKGKTFAEIVPSLRRAYERVEKTINWRRAALSQVLTLQDVLLPCNWSRIFGNNNPVIIEIGPGKGQFLFRMASEYPDINFLGIEWAGRYFKILCERLPKRNLPNIRLIKADARELFTNWIPTKSVQEVHVYFPDPWPKKRQQKHRLLNEDFIRQLGIVLQAKGKFCFATDVQSYFEEIKQLLTQCDRMQLVFEKVYHPDDPLGALRSNFEVKYKQEGRLVYEAHWQLTNQHE
ncbi:tRNA (guanosine(46)-N7)-methyltransferase TrmB [bacterium]|nr:tRNA (guanosine(46)-N7)-methyltransferase TrmB [bacterium]